MDETMLETAEKAPDWYAGRRGYDPEFLGPHIGLPALSPQRQGDRLALRDGSGHELKYTHFSVVMSRSRKLAFFTAVNIDGQDLKDLPRDRDVWYLDPRIDREQQMDPRVYKHPDLDRGHLVRRLDPVWGEEAATANEDTFHFTNCSPQHKDLNQKTWLGLEKYLLDNAKVHRARVVVFSGPVFRDDDPLYLDEFAIPAEFWKVAAVVRTDGQLSAAAYLQSQRDLIADLEAWAGFGQYKTYQVPVAHIEQLVGLDFGELRHHDPLEPPGAEAAPRARHIERADDILL